MQQDQEFYVSVAIIGGVVLAGLMISIGLALVAMAVYNRVTKRKITKELYDEKERKNGQPKRGARGKW